MKKTLLTKTGLTQLQKEKYELENNILPAAVKRLVLARQEGDWSENTEYQSAREDLNNLQAHLSELEEILKNAHVIESNCTQKGTVGIGCSVTVRTNGKKMIFVLVGEKEADPKSGKISLVSPLGQMLMGKKVSDIAEIAAPSGAMRYEILAIN